MIIPNFIGLVAINILPISNIMVKGIMGCMITIASLLA